MTSKLRFGGLIRLQVQAAGTLAWAAPLWATLCGAVASGRLTLTLPAALRLLLVLLLVEAGWGTLWSALATTDWAALLRRWRNWHAEDALPTLPYARPDSPGERVSRWLGRLRSWARTLLFPTAGRAIGAIVSGAIISLAIAATLGTDHLLLTAAALAVMQIALLTQRREVSTTWDSILRIGLPWLAGHIAFGPLLLGSLALAAAFTVTLAAVGSGRQALERTLWPLGQFAAMVFLLPKQPIAIPFLFLLLIPQLLMAAVDASNRHWTRQAWPWLAAAMLLAAWVL